MASMMLAGKGVLEDGGQGGLASAGSAASAARAAAIGTPVAGAHQVHRAQPQEQRDGGDDFEVDDRLERRCGPSASMSPPPAMPYTSVPNSSGAMIDRISRRNTLLAGPSCFADVRRDDPQRDARGHADEDPGGERNPLHRSPHFSFCAQHVEEHHARADGSDAANSRELRHTTVSPSRSGPPIWPSMVRNTLSSGPCDVTRMTLVSGTSTGRLVSMCGQIGVMQMRGHGGEDDRAAGGERVRRGAGGRGDDQAVGLVGADELVVHVGVQIDHAGERGLGEHGVVRARRSEATTSPSRTHFACAAACACRCDARRAGRAPAPG